MSPQVAFETADAATMAVSTLVLYTQQRWLGHTFFNLALRKARRGR